jgi:hypothetical protein
MVRFPVTDHIIFALARLVDDSQVSRRDPSHADIEYLVQRTTLAEGDPNRKGVPVGKEKRVRAILSWATDSNPEGAEQFAKTLLSHIRSCGGFREQSPNFVGHDVIDNLAEAFREVGVVLSQDGTLTPTSLDGLSGRQLTKALKLYVLRAKKGHEDAALLVGTSKDLMEAVASHIVEEEFGNYSYMHFPMLMGQAFTALEMTAYAPANTSLSPKMRLEKAMYEMACSVNALRNKEGSGHGRPWIPQVTAVEATASIEFIGVISEVLLSKLEDKRKAPKA